MKCACWYECDDPPALTEVAEADYGVPCVLVTHGSNDCDVTDFDVGGCAVHVRHEVDEDSRKILLTFDPESAADFALRLLRAREEYGGDVVELKVDATMNLSWDCNPSPRLTSFHEYVGLLFLIDFLRTVS